MPVESERQHAYRKDDKEHNKLIDASADTDILQA